MEYQVSLWRDTSLVYPEGLQPMGRTHAGAEEKYEEGAAEKTLYKLIKTLPFLTPSVPLGCGGRR